jgi:hypothetical protein
LLISEICMNPYLGYLSLRNEIRARLAGVRENRDKAVIIDAAIREGVCRDGVAIWMDRGSGARREEATGYSVLWTAFMRSILQGKERHTADILGLC